MQAIHRPIRRRDLPAELLLIAQYYRTLLSAAKRGDEEAEAILWRELPESAQPLLRKVLTEESV